MAFVFVQINIEFLIKFTLIKINKNNYIFFYT